MAKYNIRWWVDGKTALKKTDTDGRIDAGLFNMSEIEVERKVADLLNQGVYTIDISKETPRKKV